MQRSTPIRCCIALACAGGILCGWMHPAQARPARGFHEGPYLQLVSGARDASFDTNVADGTKNSRDIEPVYGFNFGWNLTDPWAVELSALYSTAGSQNIQQHLITTRVALRATLITDMLTDFRSLRILPFVRLGMVGQLNILPGATGSGDTRVLQWGGGIHTGGGVGVLFHDDTIYVHASGGSDLLQRRSVSQILGGIPTRVYAGGWDSDWIASAGLGVHF